MLAVRWEADFLTMLERYITTESAAAVSMLTDGAIMQTALAETPSERTLLERAIAALWNPRQETTQ